MKSGTICRPWREKSMKNDRKVMKVEEKVFLYIKNSQQSNKVTGTRKNHLTRRKVTPPPSHYPSPLPSARVNARDWAAETGHFSVRI